MEECRVLVLVAQSAGSCVIAVTKSWLSSDTIMAHGVLGEYNSRESVMLLDRVILHELSALTKNALGRRDH